MSGASSGKASRQTLQTSPLARKTRSGTAERMFRKASDSVMVGSTPCGRAAPQSAWSPAGGAPDASDTAVRALRGGGAINALMALAFSTAQGSKYDSARYVDSEGPRPSAFPKCSMAVGITNALDAARKTKAISLQALCLNTARPADVWIELSHRGHRLTERANQPQRGQAFETLPRPPPRPAVTSPWCAARSLQPRESTGPKLQLPHIRGSDMVTAMSMSSSSDNALPVATCRTD
mmetsp:Transcript_29483/g.74786  ORF Transcript_29483/g.74786 Transcript_29483/m.74786 type:complete len:236 (+) Transcript_29483:498-1205(+)